MAVSIRKAGLLATAKFVVAMARDPLRCMCDMGLSLPSMTLMPMGPARDRSRKLLYLTGGANARPIFTNTDNFRTANVPPRLRGGGAQTRLRRGLVGSWGAEHSHYRASFIAQTGRSMMAEFSVGVASHVDAILRNVPEDEPVDLVKLISDLVRYYAVVTMFKDDNFEVALEVGREITAWIELAYTAGNILLPVNIPGLPHWKFRRSAELIEAKILKWASMRRGMDAKRDLMSMFVNGPDEKGQPLSEERLAGHLLILYEASFTTSVSGLIWSLFILMQHPNIAHQLCDELDGSGVDPLSNGMKFLDLPLLDRVLKESMRLFTPVPYLVRGVNGSAQYLDANLRSKDVVIIGAWATNRLASVYSEAEKFLPDRWTKTDSNAYDHLIFGAGPRRCVGYGLAMIIIKITLASILLKRRPKLVPETRIDTKVAITLRSRQPIPVIMAGRDANFERANIHGTVARLYA
jgi:cytochrome P450